MGFSNPSAGDSSLQMNRSGKLFTQSCLNTESFSLYQCGHPWEPAPAQTTKHWRHFMHKHDCFKNVTTAGSSPTSTPVRLLFYWCISGFWEHWEGGFTLHRKLFQEQSSLIVTDLILSLASHLFTSICSENKAFSSSKNNTFPLAVNKQKFCRDPLRQN